MKKMILFLGLILLPLSAVAQVDVDSINYLHCKVPYDSSMIDSISSAIWSITASDTGLHVARDRNQTDYQGPTDPSDYNPYGPAIKIVSVESRDGLMEITFRQASMIRWCEGGGPPDHIWKDVYIARGDSVVFSHRVEGQLQQAKTIPEKFVWPE